MRFRDPFLAMVALSGFVLMLSFVAKESASARPVFPEERRLRLFHTHTGERIDIVYRRGDAYLDDALGSLHMQARAIDIRLPGVSTRDLRSAALSLHRGGVGYYPRSGFIHVDTGRVTQWCFGCSDGLAD